MEADGQWNKSTDSTRLSSAIRTIEELSEGACRFNCRTNKEAAKIGHAAGFEAAKILYKAAAKEHFMAGYSFDPVIPAEEAWKKYHQEGYILESEIGFIKETPNEL